MFPPLAALALALGGCGGGGAGGEDGDRMVVSFANASEPADLDPHAVSGLTEFHAISCFLEGLVIMDPRTLEPLPGQAES